MSTFSSIEDAQKYFSNDRFAMTNGVSISDMGPDWSICSMDITDNHRNANGRVMGGAIFTLADFAVAVASNNVHKITVAWQVSSSFLSSSKGTKLYAKAECKRDGKTCGVYNVNITDDLGKDIAQMVFSNIKL